MTSCKTTANLTAIYNLKFYRKQNCWKLNAPIRKEKGQKEKLSTSLRNKLNETYLITDKVQNESSEINPLNVAFFEPEREHEVCDPQQSLSQQWLEPVNIWPYSVEADESEDQQINKKIACIHKRLQVLLKAAEEQEDAKSVSALESAAQEIPENFDFNLEEEHIVEDVEEHIVEDNHWMQPVLYQTVRSEPWINPVDDVWLDHDVIDGLNHNQARPDGDWDSALFNHPTIHPPSTISLNEKVDSDSALDSSTEFMRGAHKAPHSSEIDIALPPEFMFGTLSTKVLRNLNTRQLVQAMSEHSSMIVKLIKEKGKRTERSFTSDLGSYDEYPTRDVGPFPNGDEFVAGSHLGLYKRVEHNEFFGRGRGRLVQNCQRY